VPHLSLASGVPATAPSGVRVGATDFREFSVGAGLPSGITAFGVGASSPSTVLIGNDPAEGNFFSMAGQGGNAEWGFGLDGFFGEMDSGEMLCRIRGDWPLADRHSIGAAASMSGLTDVAPFSAWGSTQFLRSGTDIETEARAEFGGTFFQIIQSADVQEPFIDGVWFWLRVRRIPNVGDPSRDDWETRSWYGGLSNEPAAPDGVAVSQFRFTSGALNVGWFMLAGLSALNEQKIAFLSFSANPLIEPPPLPSDISEVSIWIPNPLPQLPEAVFPPAPKPTGLGRPIVEFDVRFLTDEGLEYEDGDSVKQINGGEGWKDLEITDPQGRTDAGLTGAQGDGNILFVKNGWNEKRKIDAVRFVGSPVSAPANPEGNFIGWPGGGNQPENSNWIGNEYTYIGVMRCTDISQFCCLFGKVSGVTPVNGNPIATGVWVQPDGSVAVHHTDEESFSQVQPGSIFSLESAPGIVKAGDSIIITVTHSSLFATQGKILRVNGKVVASNPNAIRNLQEMSAPALGSHFPQQDGSPGNPGTVCGLDKLIVYFAAFGTLLTPAQIDEYEAFLALTFQISIGTQWAFEPPPVPDETVWFPEQPAPAQPVIANQVIELDSRPDLPDPALDPPGEPNRFGTWPDTSGNGVQVSNGAAPTQPIWEQQGWDPNGRRLGVVSFRDIQEHMNVFDGGFGLGYPGNRVTLFFVVEATDLTTDHIVVIGGNDNRNLRNLSVIINQAGAVEFNYFDEVPLTADDTITADGLVSQGDLLQITCRAGAGGRIIRVNGVEEGSSVGTGQLITYPTMFISNHRFLQGASMRLAWYSGHNSEATDSEILEMEAFLRGAFFQADPPPPTGWS
jgi:hypothetical protein